MSKQKINFHRRDLISAVLAAPLGAYAATVLGDTVKISSPPLSSVFKKIRRQYADGRFGQVHLYRIDPERDTGKTPLVCLPPNASSGEYFKDFMLEMGRDRTVIAVDTPGYGLSDSPPEPASMKDLALATGDALDALGYGKSAMVDVVGWRTGARIAVELAVQRPDLLRRIVLPRVPYGPPEELERRYSELVVPMTTAEEATKHMMQQWDYWVMRRPEGVSLDRGIENFVDYMQPGTNHWWAYHSVFTYEPQKRVPLIKQPVLVFNFSPEEGTPRGFDALAKATLVDTPELGDRIFHKHIERVAEILRSYLDK